MSHRNVRRSDHPGTLLAAAKRISSALDNAIRDWEAEKTHRLIYFYDADVIVDSVLGLTTWDPSKQVPDVSDLSYVTRALFSVGFLPAAHLLRPHMVEVDRFARQVSLPRGLESGFRAAHLRHLSRQWNLDQHDRRVMENADDWAEMERMIRQEGFEIFVKLELCYGGLPYDRLLRILPHCIISPGILEHPPIRAGDEFAEMVSRMLATPTIRRHKQINNLVDGYALSELAYYVAAGQPVRFYTETLPMQQLGEYPQFRDPSGHTIFRDAEYFIMRCSFPAIGFTHLEPQTRESISAERTISDLVVINQKLKELFSAGWRGVEDVELQRAIEYEKVDSGESLAELIDDFYQLRFLSSVFLGRWRVPVSMREFVPYLTNFFDHPQRLPAVREALGWRLSVTSAVLEQEISHLAKWRSDVSYIHEVITRRRHEFFDQTPDPWRDLGLGQWGLDGLLPEKIRNELCCWLSDIADTDIHVGRLASDLALQLVPDTARDSDNFTLLVCKLWCLQMYDRMMIEWQGNADLVFSDTPEALQVLYFIAQLRTMSVDLETQSAQATQRVLNVVQDAQRAFSSLLTAGDPRIVGIAFMGEAYVSYWAWRRLLEFNETANAQVMAERSFDAAHRALQTFPTRGLAWAFAINHCVYVGTVANIKRNQTGLLRTELLLVNPKYYHYRFADTAARHFTEEVRQEILHWGVEAIASSPTRTQHVCNLIRKAQKILNASPPSFGDEEVELHRMLLHGFHSSLGCH